MNQPTDSAAKAAPLVFVVDDEPMLLELAETVLTAQGFSVQAFRDPDTAVRTYAQAAPRPVLIITDYAMNTMTGLDLIQECKRLNPAQKIILLSGTVDASIYRDAPHKPDRFLAKPYQTGQLLDAVFAVLAGRAAE